MRVYIKIISLLLLISVSGCCRQNEDDRKTLLIYLAANNNLTPDACDNLQSLMTGYLPEYEDNNTLLVYIDVDYNRVPSRNEINDEIFQQPSLLRLFKDDTGEARIEIIKKYPEANDSTDPDILSEVLRSADALFPSEEAGLILWSHATGWLPSNYYSAPYSFIEGVMTMQAPEEDPYAHIVKSFGNDSKTKNEMEISELRTALPRKYSYIIFDCCLMGCIEVAYELRNNCDYVMFSPTEILTDGYPYDVIIDPLLNRKEADLTAVGQHVFEYYNKQSGDWKSVTISLVDNSKLEELAERTKEIFSLNRDKIEGFTKDNVQRYSRFSTKDWFFDLQDFCDQLSSLTPSHSAELTAFKKAVSEAVIYKATTPKFLSITIDPNKFSGLSTYIPVPKNSVLDAFYKTLEWNKATGLVE